jgi:hypothetical protein
MTSSNPPYPYFNNIAYNSAFFTSIDSGLTIAQANSKYLQKTIPDTATALETFNGITNIGQITIIDSPVVNTQLTLKADLGSAEIILDNGYNTVVLNHLGLEATSISSLDVGTTSNLPLSVGTGTRSTAVVHHYSDGDNAVAGANVHLNNGTNNLSNTGIHNGVNSGGAVNIATGSGSTTATTIGGGSITINKPLTVGYTPPTNVLASLAFIGGTLKATSSFVYTISTTNRAFAPLNGLPNGRYLFKVYVFIGGNTPTEVIAVLCYSSSAITNSQSTGLTLIYDGNEAYCITSLTGRVSLNPIFLYDVASPNNNIAIAVQSGVNLSTANVFTINAIRIG